jgi:hypothetical protein
MRAKLILLTLAVLAISGIALPQTIALFAGQHYWYDLSGNENDIPCEKCHADIAEEMSLLITIHAGETGYERMGCGYCHRTFSMPYADNINQTIYQNYLYTYASVSGTYSSYTPGKEAHAATTVPCMYCHSGAEWGEFHSHSFTEKSCSCHGTADTGSTGDWREYYYHGDRFYTGTSNDDPGECVKCHGTGDGSTHGTIYIPPAGGFGLTANASDTGSLAAHSKFIEESVNDNTLTDANEACIACHTGIAVKINFSHARSLEFNIGLGSPITTDYGPHNWSVTDWQTNGTAYAIIWGNTTGNASTTYGEIEWPGNIDSIYS